MFEWLAKWFAFCVIRLVSWSYRFVLLEHEHGDLENGLHTQSAFLLAFWHEHLVSPLFFFEGQKFCVLTSDSRDGKIIGFQCEKFGNAVVHGSQNRDGKDKGGLRALIGLLNHLKQGTPVAITVDGSIGPRRYVKAGVIELARKSQAPIIPFACAASRFWTLKTWDQFKIPKPFAKIIIQLGAPIVVPTDLKKEDMEAFQSKVADAINLQEEIALDYLAHGDDHHHHDHEHGESCDHG